jgi:hypothetical protein
VAARGIGAPRTGNAGDIRQDHAPPGLAKRAAASEVERCADSTGGALEFAAIHPLGDPELALDLLRRSVKEEATGDNRSLAFWK